MNVIMPEQVGRYRIIGELGRGAMGVVYRASDPAIGRSVAIKTIRISDLHDPEAQEKLRERLFREARSAGVLSHPNIVTIYDMDEDSGLAYIAMAFVNGPTLEQILGAAEPLSGARMLRVLRQTASALDYAHGRGIVHRDVKPANIMTDEDGSVKVTDFGIARMTAPHEGTLNEEGGLNEDATISGTPNYMSPEQVQGTPLDGRSDQFSLAVIAYEILTGERPFPGEHLSTIVYKIVAEEPQPAHRLNGTLTPRIDEVLRKALAKNPEERFPNCSNFVGALELACAESRGWTTLAAGAGAGMATIAIERGEVAVAPLPNPAEKHQPSRIFALVMSVLVVAGLAAVFLYEAGSPRRVPDASPAPAPAAASAVVKKTEPEPEPEPLPKPVEVATVAVATAETSALSAPEPPRIVPSPFPGASPPARLQDIWITTSPAGSLAVLDGNQGLSCVAPCQLHGAPGVHRLIVSQPGYLTEVREIRIEDTALTVPLITLRQPSGTLMLTTNPPGASIRINGELLTRVTPAELSLRPGSYSVTVEKDGATRTERIQLRESPFYLRIPLGH